MLYKDPRLAMHEGEYVWVYGFIKFGATGYYLVSGRENKLYSVMNEPMFIDLPAKVVV